MTSDSGHPRPATPAMMPKKKPAVPPAPAVRRSAQYAVAVDVPQRGWADAVCWPDTGIFLVVGSRDTLPAQVRRHLRGRVRVAAGVAREVRGLAQSAPSGSASDRDHAVYGAASRAVRELLVADRSLPIVELTDGDLPAVDTVVSQLKALEGGAGGGKKHAGEAQAIVLASKARGREPRQLLLTNDGGASVVAARHGVKSRHSADLLAEMVCAASGPDAAEGWAIFAESVEMSAPPRHARPAAQSAIACGRDPSGDCVTCDAVEARSP